MSRAIRWILPLCAVLAFAPPALAQDDAKKVEKGKAVYLAQHCAMCHQIAGKGNPKTPLDDVGSKLTADEIRKYIVTPQEANKQSKMKAYPSLQGEDLDALVAYLSGLKKKQ